MQYDQFGIRFIAEQDGKTERYFKRQVSAILMQLEEPVRAYLCRIAYPWEGITDAFHVALCLASITDVKWEMQEGVASVFRRMFGTHEHLDIMFIGRDQEARLLKVCSPFLTVS
jgi:hypothetical protein